MHWATSFNLHVKRETSKIYFWWNLHKHHEWKKEIMEIQAGVFSESNHVKIDNKAYLHETFADVNHLEMLRP